MSVPSIIYEDKNFFAVNKPAGMLVHAVLFKRQNVAVSPTLTNWFLSRYPETAGVGDDPKMRPGIVHRLDRETSGILLVARTQKYFLYLKDLFQRRQVLKTYYALVYGRVAGGRRGIIKAPIGILSGSTKRSTTAAKMSKAAVTEYALLWRTPYFSFLKAYPRTGRTHQIRVHLASRGYPVVGDKLYGRRAPPSWATRTLLHAGAVEFTTAEGKRLKLAAELPADFKNAIRLARGWRE